MTEEQKPKTRTSLTKSQRQTAVGAELISLCQFVTEDGRLTADETAALRHWLETNQDSDLPAIAFLDKTVTRILADGFVTDDELRELYGAIEIVLPPDIRAGVRGNRRALEINAREEKIAREAEEAHDRRTQAALDKAARAEARERLKRSEPLDGWDFMVAGVVYSGRASVVEKFANVGDPVFLARDPNNSYSRHAVEVRLANGMQIGFVPEQNARQMAPKLDKGIPHAAFISKILSGGRAPIPIVIAELFRSDAGRSDLVHQRDIPPKVYPPTPAAVRSPAPQPEPKASAPSISPPPVVSTPTVERRVLESKVESRRGCSISLISVAVLVAIWLAA